MRSGPLIWATGTLASVTVHIAAAGVLYLAIRPGDIPTQTPPETELQLATYQVERTEARETAPDAEQATSADAKGTSVGQNAIATSRADPVSPQADVALQSVPAQQRAEIEQLNTTPLASVDNALDQSPALPMPQSSVEDLPTESPIAEALPVTAEQVVQEASVTSQSPELIPTISPAIQSGDTVGISVPTAAPASIKVAAESANPVATRPIAVTVKPAATSRITGSQVPLLNASPTVLASLRPQAAPLLQAPTEQQSLPALAPPEIRATAALAFPNTGEGPVDPVSLSAFQSFMQPDDPSGAAAQVRDSVAGALSAIPCSRVQARFDPEQNALILTGHVPEDALRGTVLTAMAEKMGADIPVRENLLILPRPQCGALTGIASVGLPQSTDQITNPLLVGENTHATEFRYVDGQPLVLDLQGADYDAYVYVDYFDADGNVLHLAPNEFTPLSLTKAKSALRIGSDHALAPGEPGLFIKIGPPFGQEIAVAFAASVPLYEGTRPLVEPADDYLAWMQERVAEARSRTPDFKGEWVYFFVSTTAD